MIPYYNNSGGYPVGYPPQTYAYNNMGPGVNQPMNDAYQSPYSPFIYMNPPEPSQPSQLENVYVSPDGVVHGATEGPIQYTSMATQLQQQGGINPQQMPYGYNQVQPQQNIIPQPQNMMVNGGYNPYAAFGSQQPQPQQQQYYIQPQFNNYNIGGAGYGYNNVYYGGYNNPLYNFEYQYANMLRSEEYTFSIPGFDPFDCLKDAVLTDEEKKLSKMHTPTGYAYNGQPIYSQEQINEYNRIYEDTRKKVADFWAKLSIAAHRGSGETEIDEDAIRAQYDPKLNPINQQQRYITQLSPDELEKREAYARVEQTASLHSRFVNVDGYYAYVDQKRAEGYAKIKESHDKILGLQPGPDMTLKNYLSNAGLLYVDAISREAKRLSHDGSIKYARSSFKNRFAKPGAGPYDPVFQDEDFVPIEKRMKEKYLMSKFNSMFNTISVDANGTITPKLPPAPPGSNQQGDQDYEARAKFLNSAMKGQTPPW